MPPTNGAKKDVSPQWQAFRADLAELVKQYRDQWPDDAAVKADIARHADALGLDKPTLAQAATEKSLKEIYTRMLDSVTAAGVPF